MADSTQAMSHVAADTPPSAGCAARRRPPAGVGRRSRDPTDDAGDCPSAEHEERQRDHPEPEQRRRQKPGGRGPADRADEARRHDAVEQRTRSNDTGTSAHTCSARPYVSHQALMPRLTPIHVGDTPSALAGPRQFGAPGGGPSPTRAPWRMSTRAFRTMFISVPSTLVCCRTPFASRFCGRSAEIRDANECVRC